jgi:serine protease Do
MKRGGVYLTVLLTGFVLGAAATRSLVIGQPKVPVTGLQKETASYRAVVKQVLPAVVSIDARARMGDADRAPRQPGDVRQGFGSGVLVDPKGVVLTNHHVVEGAEEAIVTLMDGRKFTTRDIKSDPKSDLAILRLKAEGNLPFLEMGDSDEMEIGDHVLAVGAPFGLVGSVTHGIISGKGRSLKLNQYEDFLQTDAAVNPGNSGGPLINLEGKLVGITTAIKSRTGSFQGVGLAISSNLARDIMKKLQRDGVVRRGWLGVQIADRGEAGVPVTRVLDESPASKGGLKQGDVITEVGGQKVRDSRDLQRVIADLPLGKPVRVAILRDGREATVEVVIEEQPEQ